MLIVLWLMVIETSSVHANLYLNFLNFFLNRFNLFT